MPHRRYSKKDRAFDGFVIITLLAIAGIAGFILSRTHEQLATIFNTLATLGIIAIIILVVIALIAIVVALFAIYFMFIKKDDESIYINYDSYKRQKTDKSGYWMPDVKPQPKEKFNDIVERKERSRVERVPCPSYRPSQEKEDFKELDERPRQFTKKRLLTKSEHKFFYYLMEAKPKGIAITCKPGLWAVVQNIHKEGRNKISQKHLDFALYDWKTMEVKLVIELDDPSHLREKVQQRDKTKDDILKDAGIRILRIPTSSTYDVDDLRCKILAALTVPVLIR